MSFSPSLIPLIIAVAAGLFNLTRRTWLANLISLALQYIAVFLLMLTVWEPMAAVIKLLVGLVVVVLISLTLRGLGMLYVVVRFEPFRRGELFRLFAGLSLLLFIVVALPQLQSSMFPRTPQTLLLGALAVMALALLQLGLNAEPFYVILGLLSFLSGFELLYASLEYSALLEGFFTLVKLGLALAAPYIFNLGREP